MPYLNCPSCGLTVAMSSRDVVMRHCPRCFARRTRLVELTVSVHPHGRDAISPPQSPWSPLPEPGEETRR
jgi:hypothetical protein